MKTCNWSKVVMDRETWRRVVEHVKIFRVPRKEVKDNTDVFGIIQYLDAFDHAVFEIKQMYFGGRFSCCTGAKSRE